MICWDSPYSLKFYFLFVKSYFKISQISLYMFIYFNPDYCIVFQLCVCVLWFAFILFLIVSIIYLA